MALDLNLVFSLQVCQRGRTGTQVDPEKRVGSGLKLMTPSRIEEYVVLVKSQIWGQFLKH